MVMSLDQPTQSLITRLMEWWSNDVKNTMIQGGKNRFRIEFGFDFKVFHISSLSDNRIYPIVIVKGLKVKYTLSRNKQIR